MDENIRRLLARHVIRELGGTAATARICGVKPPSVSGWKRKGIPAAREQYLRLLRPAAFVIRNGHGEAA